MPNQPDHEVADQEKRNGAGERQAGDSDKVLFLPQQTAQPDHGGIPSPSH